MFLTVVDKKTGRHILDQLKKLKEKMLRDGSWRKVAAEKVLQVAETKQLRIYLYRRQATVEEWVVLRTIFDVCTREEVYEGGGKLWVPWCIQAEADKQLRVTLEEILAAARERRQREFFKRGEGGVEGEGTYIDGGGGEANDNKYDGTETGDARVGG